MTIIFAFTMSTYIVEEIMYVNDKKVPNLYLNIRFI